MAEANPMQHKPACKRCGKPTGYKAVGGLSLRSLKHGHGRVVGTTYCHPDLRWRGYYHTSCLVAAKAEILEARQL